jgi:hypothetical protein
MSLDVGIPPKITREPSSDDDIVLYSAVLVICTEGKQKMTL